MSKLNFNAAEVKPESRPEPVPAGWYNLMIVESEQKPTASGGIRLAAVLRVIDGQFANRQIYDSMNIVNSNPVAQEIALGRLSAYCHAVGVMNITDTSQLHGKPFKAKIDIRKAQDGYDAQNVVKAVKGINEPVEGGPAGSAVTATGNTPSWATQGAAAPAATVAAPAAAPAPAPTPTPPAPVPVPAPEPVKTMTAKAQGATYETFISAGWTEAAMIEQGYLVVEVPVAATPAPPAATPPPPVMPTAGGGTPPWGKK